MKKSASIIGNTVFHSKILIVSFVHFTIYELHRTSDFLQYDTLLCQLLLNLSQFSFSLTT